jgi:hypothetical protein
MLKTKLIWLHFPADVTVIPEDCKFLVITRDGDLFFAERIGDEIEVEVPEDFEDEEVDVVWYAEVDIPEDA